MNNKLLNIYCARLSEDQKKVVLTLVRGEGETREFFTCCLKLESYGKVQTKIYEKEIDGTKEVYITLPLSHKEAPKEDNLPF